MSERGHGGGIGFFGLMGIVFITLRLSGVVNWSWWWVLAPLWGPALLVAAVTAIYLLFLLWRTGR